MEPTRKIWAFMHEDVYVEVSLHGEGEEYSHEGRGVFCYYLYLYECKTPKEVFESLWLEDKLIDCVGGTLVDYYSLPILDMVELHGGITFYQKLGHSVGHRIVKIGCDFNHLWDEDKIFDVENIITEAKASAIEAMLWIQAEKEKLNKD